jgi:small-conductance mechanosensitive channel
VLAIASVVAAESFGDLEEQAWSTPWLVGLGGAVALLITGVVTVRAIARAVMTVLKHHAGDERSAPLGIVITLIGYLVVVMTVLSLFGVDLDGLVLGGALTGVILGIAGQQVLANLFAGIVLLVNRPFTLGDFVVLRSGPLGGEYKGVITDMSLFYVRMHTEMGPVALPNAGVLASAIGPGAAVPEEDEDKAEEKKDQDEGRAPPATGGAPTGKPPGT